MKGRSWWLSAMVAAGVLAAAPGVAAGPAKVDSTQVAEAPVEQVNGVVESRVFAEAHLDGSVAERGREITLLADVFFAYDEAKPTGRAHEELARLVPRLTAAGARSLIVIGHTDSDGTTAHNDDLSLRRAQAVAAELAGALPALTIVTAGRGESEPVADNASPEGRARNRRVTISLGA